MVNINKKIVSHYQDDGLLGRIDAGLRASGLDPAKLKAADLAPVDEFHIGGREATLHILSQMNITAEDTVLDIGCGIGGAARTLVSETGCHVTGIDLTPEYIDIAKELTRRCAMEGKAAFQLANACAMPFADQYFDSAISLHVAMNIEDREALYGETARVLKPGAIFALYDVMTQSDEPLEYPAPWAASARTSFLKSPSEMRALLQEAGFTLIHEENRGEMAKAFFQKAAAGSQGNSGPSPLGVHVVLGAEAPVKIRNTMRNIEAGRIAPVIMIARKR
jgi:ubiquinone/menaquinone biosynthesis C-methylase UbiE